MQFGGSLTRPPAPLANRTDGIQQRGEHRGDQGCGDRRAMPLQQAIQLSVQLPERAMPGRRPLAIGRHGARPLGGAPVPVSEFF